VSITNLTLLSISVDRKLDVIQDTEAFVQNKPGPAAAVKTEPVSPSSGSLFELPTAREGIRKISNPSDILHKVRKPWQDSSNEGE